jgi:hypothetical protein
MVTTENLVSLLKTLGHNILVDDIVDGFYYAENHDHVWKLWLRHDPDTNKLSLLNPYECDPKDFTAPNVHVVNYKVVEVGGLSLPFGDDGHRFGYDVIFVEELGAYIQFYGFYDSWTDLRKDMVRQVFPQKVLLSTWESSPQKQEEIELIKQTVQKI